MTFLQLFDAIGCEAVYCWYRGNELAHKRRPLPRGPKFIREMKDYLDWANEKMEHPIEIVTDYRSRNGAG